MTLLETDILLSRLCTKVLKQRTKAKVSPVRATEEHYIVTGRWVGATFVMEVLRGPRV